MGHAGKRYPGFDGQRTTLFLTVNPSYLYVLSDDDLDNPTLTIE